MPMANENQVEKQENPELRPVHVNVEGNTTTNEEERTDDEKDSFLENTNSDNFKDEKQTKDAIFPLEFGRLLKDGLKLGKNTTKLSKAFSLIQNNSIALRNLVVAGATFGLERLLNAEVFSCPVSGHEQYGFAYLFAPVFILFCANVIVIGEVWALSSRMYVKRYRRRGDCVARVLPSLFKACVGPAVWLVVSLQNGDYYVCATVGPFPAPSNLTSAQEIQDTKSKVEKSKSESLVLSWVFLVITVFIGTAMIVWKHCFLKDNLLMKNLYEFERREALSAKKTFTEYMKGDKSSSESEVETSSYGRKDERVKLYEAGIPEIVGRKTIEKIFEGCHGDKWADGHRWHYVNAYKAFREMYPRISTGSPLDPWRVVVGDVHGERSQKTCRFKWVPHCAAMTSSWGELRPLNLTDVNPNMKEDLEKESCV